MKSKQRPIDTKHELPIGVDSGVNVNTRASRLIWKPSENPSN